MNGVVTNSSITNLLPQRIKIFPNPTNGLITIDLHKNQNWKEMKLINSIGQVVYTGPVAATFDMGKYSAGIYIIELLSDEGKYAAAIIRE